MGMDNGAPPPKSPSAMLNTAPPKLDAILFSNKQLVKVGVLEPLPLLAAPAPPPPEARLS